METCIDYIDYSFAVVSTDEPKRIRELRKLKEEYPDDVIVRVEPENNDGNMIAWVPVSWVKIRPKIRRAYTDEQLTALREKGRNLAKKYSK